MVPIKLPPLYCFRRIKTTKHRKLKSKPNSRHFLFILLQNPLIGHDVQPILNTAPKDSGQILSTANGKESLRNSQFFSSDHCFKYKSKRQGKPAYLGEIHLINALHKVPCVLINICREKIFLI